MQYTSSSIRLLALDVQAVARFNPGIFAAALSRYSLRTRLRVQLLTDLEDLFSVGRTGYRGIRGIEVPGSRLGYCGRGWICAESISRHSSHVSR
jgi:hypothetical protein